MSKDVYQCKRCSNLFTPDKSGKMYSRNIPFNVCPSCRSTQITFIKMDSGNESYLNKFFFWNLKV